MGVEPASLKRAMEEPTTLQIPKTVAPLSFLQDSWLPKYQQFPRLRNSNTTSFSVMIGLR